MPHRSTNHFSFSVMNNANNSNGWMLIDKGLGGRPENPSDAGLVDQGEEVDEVEMQHFSKLMACIIFRAPGMFISLRVSALHVEGFTVVLDPSDLLVRRRPPRAKITFYSRSDAIVHSSRLARPFTPSHSGSVTWSCLIRGGKSTANGGTVKSKSQSPTGWRTGRRRTGRRRWRMPTKTPTVSSSDASHVVARRRPKTEIEPGQEEPRHGAEYSYRGSLSIRVSTLHTNLHHAWRSLYHHWTPS